jgi:hypothetical protein
MKKVNSYNIYDSERGDTILYHAIAESEDRVRELAEENDISLEGLTIELSTENVRNEMGRPYSDQIEAALVY